MTIGNQDKENEGEASNEDNINDVLPLHETSYNGKIGRKYQPGKLVLSSLRLQEQKQVQING